MGILNLVTYIPLIGAIVILFFVRKENGKAIRYTATFFAVIDFIASLYLWFNFDPHGTGYATSSSSAKPIPGFRRSA